MMSIFSIMGLDRRSWIAYEPNQNRRFTDENEKKARAETENKARV